MRHDNNYFTFQISGEGIELVEKKTIKSSRVVNLRKFKNFWNRNFFFLELTSFFTKLLFS